MPRDDARSSREPQRQSGAAGEQRPVFLVTDGYADESGNLSGVVKIER
jgi:hypothetical protein